MARVLYKNVKGKTERDKALATLRKAGLRPAFTDAGALSKARKGVDVYAVARTKRVPGFKSKKEKMSYV